MGAHMLFNMDFKTEEDRVKFEKHLRKNNFNCRPLTDYHQREPCEIIGEVNYVVYFVGYMGYAEPEEILKKCLKEKIGITHMSYTDISCVDKSSYWEKLRGRW